MEWEKDKSIHAIVNNQTWYECCPICALMDIIQFGDNETENLMIAKCETTGEEITIHIYDGTVLYSEPINPVILLGGSCVTNKIFQDNITADTYKDGNFIDKPIYSVQDVIDNVVKSKLMKKEFCSFCDSEIQNNWQVILKINDDTSLKYCCYNCSKNAYKDFTENVESILITDYITGNLLDAYYAYYVNRSDVISPNNIETCIAFESMFDAYKFRGIHGGSVFMGWDENSVSCLNCGMMIKSELSTIFLLNDGSEYVYCPGCSDAAKERLEEDISAVYVGDYLTGMVFNGFDSYYVKNYNVDIPGTMGGHRIAFANLNDAEMFVNENGGMVIDWDGNVVYGQNLFLMIFVILIIIIIIVFAIRSIMITHSKHKKNFDEKNKK
jgi:nitrous oxide reductase accessory protein NosL